MVEASKQFRRVNGHLHVPKLGDALERRFRTNVTSVRQNQTKTAA
jgi:hypothetical protein